MRSMFSSNGRRGSILKIAAGVLCVVLVLAGFAVMDSASVWYVVVGIFVGMFLDFLVAALQRRASQADTSKTAQKVDELFVEYGDRQLVALENIARNVRVLMDQQKRLDLGNYSQKILDQIAVLQKGMQQLERFEVVPATRQAIQSDPVLPTEPREFEGDLAALADWLRQQSIEFELLAQREWGAYQLIPTAAGRRTTGNWDVMVLNRTDARRPMLFAVPHPSYWSPSNTITAVWMDTAQNVDRNSKIVSLAKVREDGADTFHCEVKGQLV